MLWLIAFAVALTAKCIQSAQILLIWPLFVRRWFAQLFPLLSNHYRLHNCFLLEPRVALNSRFTTNWGIVMNGKEYANDCRLWGIFRGMIFFAHWNYAYVCDGWPTTMSPSPPTTLLESNGSTSAPNLDWPPISRQWVRFAVHPVLLTSDPILGYNFHQIPQ